MRNQSVFQGPVDYYRGTTMSHPLDSLVYISIPADTAFVESFPLFDPSIPLPVQLTSANQHIEANQLTQEMILAGILTVFAYDPDNSQIEYYRSILRGIHPGIREEMTEAAILKIRNGDFELAEEIFRALRGYDPQDSLTILNLALLMDERADAARKAGIEDEADAFDSEAFKWYRMAMGADPALPEAFFNAGFFYLKQKNFKKAREALESYLKIESSDTQTTKIRKEKAEEIVKEIASRDLDDDLFKSAYDYINSGEEEKALEVIRLFMEHHPKVWNAWFLLGWALRRLERWQDARAAFEQALELMDKSGDEIETGYTDLCNELSICLMELGEMAKSRALLVSALEQEPENTKIISNLGILALRQGNKEEALSFFRTVLEFDPRDQFAREMLARE